ncbi:MAG: hypothetical protein LBQ75_08360 [Zoogloeaceae bacterium]|jgi:hypothetical protein|nr:hypothetical protein [Zoogloeaceae bacterium]
MIGLYYLIFFVVVWVALPRLLWKIWRSACEKTEGRWNFIITPVFALVALVWLTAAFWYFGGRKLYYDAEVKRLCAIDGGVNVYETVKLPRERFDQDGNVKIPLRENAKPSDEYFRVRLSTTYIRTEYENPSLWRDASQIIRRSDGKVLGESVAYVRRGGDLLGPAHPSSFSCPPTLFGINLGKAVFLKETDQ